MDSLNKQIQNLERELQIALKNDPAKAKKIADLLQESKDDLAIIQSNLQDLNFLSQSAMHALINHNDPFMSCFHSMQQFGTCTDSNLTGAGKKHGKTADKTQIKTSQHTYFDGRCGPWQLIISKPFKYPQLSQLESGEDIVAKRWIASHSQARQAEIQKKIKF